MTRIDFYQTNGAARYTDKLVCKLCQKAYENNKPVLLLTSDPQQTEKYDRLLWTIDEESFIPHDQQEQDGFLTPVIINHEAEPSGDRSLLINLSHQIPPFFAQFERVIELVTDENKHLARSHYSYYQDRGYELNHHKL